MKRQPSPWRQCSHVTPTILAREFKEGLSMVGLARKYALTRQQVEAWIRVRCARRRRG